ncbi:MAG: hypothetical protein WAV31_06210 [Candidatus Moraniibacteriota bacterium]
MEKLNFEKIKKIRQERETRRAEELQRAEEERKKRKEKELNETIEYARKNLQKNLEEAANDKIGICRIIILDPVNYYDPPITITNLPLALEVFVDDLKKIGIHSLFINEFHNNNGRGQYIGVKIDDII